jgi:hypothetical protein
MAQQSMADVTENAGALPRRVVICRLLTMFNCAPQLKIDIDILFGTATQPMTRLIASQ